MDNQSGGGENLPTQGAGPYSKLAIDLETPANEPFVVTAFRTQVRDAAPLERAGGGYRLWFGFEADPSLPDSEIWHAELPALNEQADVGPELTLAADAAWEQGRVGAPCILDLGAGELVMFYEGGQTERGIGRADSTDDGRTFTKHPGNPILPGWAQPSVVQVADAWQLYATRTDRAGIFRADSSDGENWNSTEEPVIMPRVGNADAYDRHAVSNPYVVVRETSAGNYHYGMFFNGAATADADASISVGWAGSFDGNEWLRFSSPDEPVLAPEGASEHGPAVLLAPEGGIMFYNELNQGVQALAAATHP